MPKNSFSKKKTFDIKSLGGTSCTSLTNVSVMLSELYRKSKRLTSGMTMQKTRAMKTFTNTKRSVSLTKGHQVSNLTSDSLLQEK